ncbi:MAG TPA: hypothetical protein VLY87_06545 [Flavobacterium sp.]|nr:hypothetical protein [Flavobacterium sp.]
MKKVFLTAVITLSGLITTQAQERVSQNAIGLRFSHNEGVGPEISYQRLLSESNRLELDLGFRQSKHIDAFKFTGLYQWIWNIEGGFHWYAGVGASLGSWKNDDHGHGHSGDSGAIFALDGNLGVEYNFDFPLQVFVDFRPEIYLTDYDENNFGPDFGLGARFKF